MQRAAISVVASALLALAVALPGGPYNGGTNCRGM